MTPSMAGSLCVRSVLRSERFHCLLVQERKRAQTALEDAAEGTMVQVRATIAHDSSKRLKRGTRKRRGQAAAEVLRTERDLVLAATATDALEAAAADLRMDR